MNPFEKLLRGDYSNTITRDSSFPLLGGRCSIKRARPGSRTQEQQRLEETITRDSSGPPLRGPRKSREGPA